MPRETIGGTDQGHVAGREGSVGVTAADKQLFVRALSLLDGDAMAGAAGAGIVRVKSH
jgi:hypothetical protein